ncbi:NAD(P)-dependent alcohol dehydrogenase [Ornithinibacillus californiensis]|uniref:NAD(P)-dependent alcohol dehydrogenase n=1 Tax=Ornithinibacillus californiensis TaxID=161536 RepID=UPI00064DC0CC|nr:NAD(P)-dependent alcohol dehydrogenase [Ornithinibacillus californiensis]
MKAWVYTKYGVSDVLQLKEVVKPSPKEGEVLVKVHHAAVNSWDWDLLRGKPFIVRLGAPFKPPYKILGADIAGQVEAIGTGVHSLQPGNEVFGDISGSGWGGFAEYVCVKESTLTLKPASMTFEEAASLPQASVLALQALRKRPMLQAGEKVLLNGAGGGVGTFALQLAKLQGAEVTCVDHTEKLDFLQSIGADHVVDYTQEDFTNTGQKYDLILDVVGNRSPFDYKRALNRNGTYVMIGGSLTRILQTLLVGSWLSRHGKQMSILIHKPNQDDQHTIQKLVEDGQVKPMIERCFSLDALPQALQHLGEGKAKGKIIVSIRNS